MQSRLFAFSAYALRRHKVNSRIPAEFRSPIDRKVEDFIKRIIQYRRKREELHIYRYVELIFTQILI